MLDLRLTAIAVAISLSVGALGAFWATASYKDARWQRVVDQRDAAATAALADATARTLASERSAAAIAAQLETEHAASADRHDRLLADNRRLARQLGGLRDPGARPGDCPVPAAATPSSAQDPTAAGGLPDAGAGLLSAEAAEFILVLARDADRVAAYAMTCHAWVNRKE